MDTTKPSRALVTGATGLIGTQLVKALGSEVVVVARDPEKAERTLGVKAYGWNGEADLPAEALEGVDTVFHLAGEPVAGSRWTEEKKRKILESRRLGTRAVARSIAGKPITLVSASGVGYYGDRGDDALSEKSAAGNDFLAEVCLAWEREARTHTGRVAILRTGIVLSADGGALGPMLPLFKTGLGGRLGNGRQWMPWIHIDDIVAMYLHARTHESVEGPMNAVGPEPVTNEAFAKALGHALHRPAVVPAPAFALKIALGEMGAVVLGSQRAYPRVAEATGFEFRFKTLESALADLFR